MRHLLLIISLGFYIPQSFAICSSQIVSQTPNSRYQILNSGNEVKDLKTKLIWQRCSVGQTWTGSSCDGDVTGYTWPQALETVKTGDNGWRLPNVKELYSLVNTACYNPAINEPIFPNTPNSGYWSASPLTSLTFGAPVAWSVTFGSQFVPKTLSATADLAAVDSKLMLRLVRDDNAAK